jgi:ABC-type transport system involved in cytochrome bd biosynthesis fused ATPase/permease subunit
MNDLVPQLDHCWMRLVIPMVLISILVCGVMVKPDGAGLALLLIGAGALGMGIVFVIGLIVASVIGLNESRSTESEKNRKNEGNERIVSS